MLAGAPTGGGLRSGAGDGEWRCCVGGQGLWEERWGAESDLQVVASIGPSDSRGAEVEGGASLSPYLRPTERW
eukprot:3934313-Rhodomonas_salina.1